MLKNKKIMFIIIIIVILATLITTIVLNKKQQIYRDEINITISNIIGKIKENYPEVKEEDIISILNEDKNSIKDGNDVLEKYGINTDKVSAIEGIQNENGEIVIISISSTVITAILILIIVEIYYKKRNRKIKDIIKYIEAINNRNYDLKIEENTEDDLSNFTNELYKITVMLKEQARESMKDRKVLQTSLEDISHQLKTPLTSISIMLDNIRENPNMELRTRQEFIHEISRQIEWINWLVISLLKLSKLDSNTATFTSKEIKIEKLIKDVIKNMAIPLDIKQQQVIIKGEEQVKIIGDYNWQLEALTNIVKNCIEHTPENKNIYISFEENNFFTKIVIRDEGCGIEKQDIKHIFERFYKCKNSSENSVGIGLALAKSIIEKDKGYIRCFSEVGVGTTFEIKYMK